MIVSSVITFLYLCYVSFIQYTNTTTEILDFFTFARQITESMNGFTEKDISNWSDFLHPQTFMGKP